MRYPITILLSGIALLLLLSSQLTGQELELIPSGSRQVLVSDAPSGAIALKTSGTDPQVIFSLKEGTSAEAGAHVLSFEYFCPDGVDFLEIFYAKSRPYNWSQSRQIEGGNLPKAEAWQPYSVDLKLGSKDKWTARDGILRLDFGRNPGLELQIRNLQLRAPTREELVSSEETAAKLSAKKRDAKKLEQYLNASPGIGKVDSISVRSEHVHVSGTIQSGHGGAFYLVEYEPHQNPWSDSPGRVLSDHTLKGEFSVTLPRLIGNRDRLAHRFGIVEAVKGENRLISQAVWPTELKEVAERDMPRLRPANKKGLGGVSLKAGIFEKDLSDLGITASTVNFPLGSILQKSSNPIEHVHQGKKYSYNGDAMRDFDKKIRWMTENNIVVSAILLVDKNAEPLVHPDYNPAGIYAMADMTDRESTDAYRSLVSFLAERYSRPDRAYGWITHWIVFNEVDYGWIWTNMGEQPMALYMDTYDKAMRLTWLEARRYNPTAEVFISLTHHWQYSPADNFRAYPPRDLLERMALYSEKTGDYHWGVAYHPYPQNLLKPRTWEDSKATNSFNTRYITPKNIEVLDAYLHQPRFLYQDGLRTVVLSEQGFHTPDYEAGSMLDKAAAIAYTWEKILPLKTIESFHYHRWVDHPLEGGLKVGLRTLPDETHPHGTRKEPAFTVFSALETEAHDKYIAPLKKRLGISDWSEVRVDAGSIER